MYKLLTLIFCLMGLICTAQAEESMACSVSGGKARAYYCNNPGGGSVSGKVDIDVYNEHGAIVGSSFCVGVAVAVNGCEEVCNVPAPQDATLCSAFMD